jgi:hypothetical protein
MRITEKRNEVAALIRDLKEDKVRSTHHPDRRHTNIHNVAHGWRGEQLIVAIHPAGLSTDTALGAAHAAAAWFSCDSLALTAETYVAGTPYSPLTGKRWTPGELQHVVEEHGGLETGAVVEALMTFVVNRAGDATGITERYRIDRRVNGLGIATYSIEWLAAEVMHRQEGPTVNALVQFMEDESIDAILGREMAREGISPADFGLNADEAQTHADCVAIKRLSRDGFDGAVMLLVPDGDTRRAEIIKELLGDLAQEMP